MAFVDTLYFVALFNPRDQWHERAFAASKLIADAKLITTEDVLVELLNFFSEYGEKARRGAVTQTEGILSGSNIEVAPQSHEAFTGRIFYLGKRSDGYKKRLLRFPCAFIFYKVDICGKVIILNCPLFARFLYGMHWHKGSAYKHPFSIAHKGS